MEVNGFPSFYYFAIVKGGCTEVKRAARFLRRNKSPVMAAEGYRNYPYLNFHYQEESICNPA